MYSRAWIQLACWLTLVTGGHAQWFPQKAPPISSEERERVELQVRKFLGKALGAKTAEGIQTREFESRAMVSGDLFADGRRLAVVESQGALALEVWEKGDWHLLELWNLDPVWIPAGKTLADFPEYSHIVPEPPSTPFQMQDLDGDGVPELIVTFNDDGYRLGYAIIKQVRGEAVPTLLDVYSSRTPPQFLAGRLLTYRDSGRKAWWGETEYWQWERGLPRHLATWHDDCFNPDRRYWEVSCEGSPGTLRIAESEEDQEGEEDETRFVITRSDGKDSEEMYAVVDFGWKPGQAPKVQAERPGEPLLYEAAQLYLFEKLLRMPAAAFDKEVNGAPVDEVIPLIKRLQVRVKGEPEAVQKLAAPVKP
ncbi:hypothetical protein [Prosthecobacter sp.]|uniref:hypothetical protein n=1 Tax=Prosthecobacter sp. TaxID=1965333 RepID=UPI003783E692